MAKNAEIIKGFIASWSNMDPDALASYFTDDGTYHNMPAKPVAGRENITQFIKVFLETWTETSWDILNIVEDGDVVVCERLDRTKTPQGNVDLPCVGVFEMQNGKIHVWRDYFDMATFTRAMS
ncbi:MAG: SgcJ/EcaC family oxidoreductase [Pseudomonadales bacterium]|nr:SgcJ/EcaC family oxidoreductase [Pseudomonadales bacterium]